MRSAIGKIRRGHLFDFRETTGPGERCDRLVGGANVGIERIVSHGEASPPGFWYDQEQDEWVVVLRGRARLRVEGEPDEIELASGDWIDLPAHRRHRVEWTDPEVDTVWLAVFSPAGRPK